MGHDDELKRALAMGFTVDEMTDAFNVMGGAFKTASAQIVKGFVDYADILQHRLAQSYRTKAWYNNYRRV